MHPRLFSLHHTRGWLERPGNAGGGISEMVAPCLLDLPSKSLSANLEELSSPDPDPVGAAGFEKNSSGVGQAAAVAQMASNQKSQHLPFA